MKLVRSYLLFTPLLYRILMLLIMPVAVLIFAISLIFICWVPVSTEAVRYVSSVGYW